ncbi:MAG: Bug family tripartite tricarboxylate transporter substrate binding protein [Burkholderiales bacterium]
MVRHFNAGGLIAISRIAALLCTALAVPTAFAQSYPVKPVRLISGSGAAVEGLIRQVTQEMYAGFGQPIVIENRPGGAGIVGGDACAKSAPDGYTLCMVDRTFMVLPLLTSKLPFDVAKDFEPVTNVVYAVLALVVNPSLKVNNLNELIAFTRAKPDAVNFASLGPATMANMLMEWLKKQNGVNMTHVPYKNPGALMTAMLGGETQLTYFALGNFPQHHQAGKLKVIAISGSSRSPLLPEVHTLREQGLTSIDARVWFGWLAPAKTPKEIRERIYREVNRVTSNTAFREKYFSAQGMEPIGNSPDEFAQFIKADTAASAELIRVSGARFE